MYTHRKVKAAKYLLIGPGACSKFSNGITVDDKSITGN